jgi:hypothetical protein
MAYPSIRALDSEDSIIEYKQSMRDSDFGRYTFFHKDQLWMPEADKFDLAISKTNQSIIIYVTSHGEVGIDDSSRGLFCFSNIEIWDGLKKVVFRSGKETSQNLCNGLILDWSQWLLEKGNSLKQLEKALEVLSPNEQEKLIATKSTRVSIDEVRDIPTLKMPYGQEVPVIHASSGIKRIISIAYLLVWTWQEHLRASELRQLEPSKKMVLLIDELENHLHPQWQRVILQSLLNGSKKLCKTMWKFKLLLQPIHHW